MPISKQVSLAAAYFTSLRDGYADLDLPWTVKRRREVDAGADLTPEELTQWRRAKCKVLADGSDWAHIAWIVPVMIKRKIEGYALFLCGGAEYTD